MIKAGRHFPASLLIDLPNWVGDTMMSLPATARLVRANRDGITVLNARPPMKRLLTTLFPDTRVVATSQKSSPFGTTRRLRAGNARFTIGITFRNAYRAKILLFLAAKQRFGSLDQGADLLLTQSFSTNRSRHQVFDTDPILNTLGLGKIELEDRPEIPKSLIEEGRWNLEDVELGGGPLIGLAPASASAEAKRWPVENFAQLAQRLLTHGYQPVVLIGPGEESLGLEIARASAPNLPVLGQDLDVAGLMGLCTQMDALVGIDSGPIHVASMAGTRVIALFGPTDPHRTKPTGTNDIIVSLELECSPCSLSQCPIKHRNCMRLQSIDTVMEAIRNAE